MPKKPRNRVATNPLLRKGGIHRKSRKSERQAARRALRKELGARHQLVAYAVPA